MRLSEAVILALVQGITEFMPISSSAHLILLPYVLGWAEHGLTFDVVTNAGTLTAAVIYFRRDLWRTWREARRSFSLRAERPNLALLTAAATLPVALVGLTFHGFFATGARSPLLIAATSIGFGLVLWWADATARARRDLDELGWRDAMLIGSAQALALVPGTSRSGITWTAGLFLGYNREDAARFSFLLAIPVGLLALAKDLVDLTRSGLETSALLPLVVGFFVAGISAYTTIGFLLAWVRRQRLTVFVVYRVLLGLLILGLFLGRTPPL